MDSLYLNHTKFMSECKLTAKQSDALNFGENGASIFWLGKRDSVTNISRSVEQKISRPRLAVSRARETSLRPSYPYGSQAVGFLFPAT